MFQFLMQGNKNHKGQYPIDEDQGKFGQVKGGNFQIGQHTGSNELSHH